jgi:hypothetical protein
VDEEGQEIMYSKVLRRKISNSQQEKRRRVKGRGVRK